MNLFVNLFATKNCVHYLLTEILLFVSLTTHSKCDAKGFWMIFLSFFCSMKKKKNDKNRSNTSIYRTFHFENPPWKSIVTQWLPLWYINEEGSGFSLSAEFLLLRWLKAIWVSVYFFFICHLFVIPFFGTCLSYPCNLVYDDTS